MDKKDILAEIVENKRTEVEAQKKMLPLDHIKERVTDLSPKRSMRASLADSPTGIIAEFKRRSPSKGWINREAEVAQVVPRYEQGGAAALSILTDEKYFGGRLEDVVAARPLVGIPILRKEFIVDEYQLWEAKMAGADAILLIAAALTEAECARFAETARALGLEVLLEVHSEEELRYVNPHVDMVGVNNRNLGSFHTDVQNSFRLADLLPKGMMLVSESGISNPQTVLELRVKGFRGFLIGETFMKTDNPGLSLSSFTESLKV